MTKTAIEQVREMLAASLDLDPSRSPQELRETMNAAVGEFPVPADASITPATLGGIPAEETRAAGAGKNNTILYLHGGGYVIGAPLTHRSLVVKLSAAAAATAFSLDYRLAPEHPFPAAVEDAAAAYRALLDQGRDPAHIAVSGDSAGGGLTFALLLKLRELGLPMPAAAAPISPWTDLTGQSKTLLAKATEDPVVQKEGLMRLAEWYLAGTKPDHPLASPLFADLSGLPPLLIQVGSAETLLDDAREIHDRAKTAGVDSTLEVWDEMIHVWHLFHFMLPEGAKALDKIGAFFRRHWAAA